MAVDELSTTFSALADPTRRAIVERLAASDAVAVTDIARPFDMSLPAVSRHLKVLEQAGLIERSRDARWLRCRLEPAPLREVAGWLEKYRVIWEDRFDRLDAFLQDGTPAPNSSDISSNAAGADEMETGQ